MARSRRASRVFSRTWSGPRSASRSSAARTTPALASPRHRAAAGLGRGIPYELDDLYPDAIACLEAVAALGLLRRHRRQPDGRDGALGAGRRAARRSSSRRPTSLGVRKPDPRFFERIVELAGCDAGGGRVRRRSSRERRRPRRCGGPRRDSRPARAVGQAAATPRGGGVRPRRPRVAARGASLAPMSELRIGLGVDAHAFETGVALVLGGVRDRASAGPRGSFRR